MGSLALESAFFSRKSETVPLAHCSSTRAAFCSFIFSTFGRISILYICALARLLFFFDIFKIIEIQRNNQRLVKYFKGKWTLLMGNSVGDIWKEKLKYPELFLSHSFRDWILWGFRFQMNYCFFRQPENPQVLGFRTMWTLWLDWASRKASLFHLQRRVKKA